MVTSSTNLLERRNLGFWLSYPLKWISISKDQKTKSANGPSFMRHPDCNWDGEFPVWRNPWQSLYIYIYRIYIICIYIYIDVCVCMWRGEASTALLPSYYSVASLHVLAFPNNSPSGRASVRKTSGSIVSIGNNLDVQDRSSAQIKVEVMNFARNSSESLTFGTWKWWFPNKNRLFQGKKIFRV